MNKFTRLVLKLDPIGRNWTQRIMERSEVRGYRTWSLCQLLFWLYISLIVYFCVGSVFTLLWSLWINHVFQKNFEHKNYGFVSEKELVLYELVKEEDFGERVRGIDNCTKTKAMVILANMFWKWSKLGISFFCNIKHTKIGNQI